MGRSEYRYSKLAALALFALAWLPSAALGQGAFVSGSAQGTVNGALRSLPGATVTVCAGNTTGIPCAPPLNNVLFKDAALTQSLTNPTTTDANGNYNFAVAAGTYTLTITSIGFTGTTQQITVTCGTGGCTASSLTVTGAATLGSLNVSGAGALAKLNGACLVGGTTYPTVASAVADSSCFMISDQGYQAPTLGAITFSRSVRLMLGCGAYTTTGLTFNAPVHMEGCIASTSGLFNGTSITSSNTGAGCTGAAVCVSLTSLPPPGAMEIRDVVFQGPGTGTTSTGIYFTTTVNTNMVYENGQVQGFGTGMSGAATSVVGFTKIVNINFFGNGQNVNFPSGMSGENFSFERGAINSASTWANGVVFASSAMSIHIWSESIDYNQFVCSAGRVKITNTYWEETNAVTGGTTPIIDSGCNIIYEANHWNYPDQNQRNWISTTAGLTQIAGGLFEGGGGGTNCGGGSCGPIGQVNGDLSYGPAPILSCSGACGNGAYTVFINQTGSGRVNPSFSAAGANVGMWFTGNTADWAFANIFNQAAGSTNYQLYSSGTGSGIGITAGDLAFRDGGGKIWLEFGSGTAGIKIPGATSGASILQAPATVGTTNTLPATTIPYVAGTLIPLQCVTSQKTESAADANVLTCAIPAVAGSYRLRFAGSISAASAATLGWTATWTDSNGNAATPTNLPVCLASTGTCAATTGALSAVDRFSGEFQVDVNNAGTSIVIKLTFSGTSFTAKVSATVERII